MDFCIQCKNFLFVKELKDYNKIIYYCLTCNYEKIITNNCVYKKHYKNYNDLYKNNQFLNYDVTLPRKLISCPNCKIENFNVYYLSNNLSIMYVCKKCSHFWNNN